MDGKMLARLGAIVFVAIAITATVIELTRKEYEILSLLIRNEGRIFPRHEILARVWGNDVIVTDRTVDVTIARIRKKLGDRGNMIRNKSGYGYYLGE